MRTAAFATIGCLTATDVVVAPIMYAWGVLMLTRLDIHPDALCLMLEVRRAVVRAHARDRMI